MPKAKLPPAENMHDLVAREQGHRVYFLACEELGIVKIGTSFEPGRRYQEIAPLSPAPLAFIGSVAGDAKVEAEWHPRWAHLRMHGEWFKLTEKLRKAMALAVVGEAWNSLPKPYRAFLSDAITAANLGEIHFTTGREAPCPS